jgi:uncharacterized membrane protein
MRSVDDTAAVGMRVGAEKWLVSRTPERATPILAIALVVGGLLGLVASFALTLDKLQILEHPASQPTCNINAAFQCGTNLASSQGSVFGFPNPLIGLVMFPAAVIVGVALLGGIRFPRWIWLAFNAGLAFAICFVAWLAAQSIFVLGTLCPWCAVVYVVVIPMFFGVSFLTLKEITPERGPRGLFAGLYFWTPTIAFGLYLLIFATAQIRLDILNL